METLDVFMCIMGLLIVLTGFFCAKYPHLIAGVNSLKPEEKAKVDMKGLGRFTRNALCMMGFSMVGVYYFLKLSGMDEVRCCLFSTVLVSFVGMIPFFIGSQKYMNK